MSAYGEGYGELPLKGARALGCTEADQVGDGETEDDESATALGG